MTDLNDSSAADSTRDSGAAEARDAAIVDGKDGSPAVPSDAAPGDASVADVSVADVSLGDALDGRVDADAKSAWCDEGSPAGNLVSNWSFECGNGTWSVLGPGTLTSTTTYAHTGTHSALVTGRTAAYSAPAQDLTVLITPGQAYAASAWGMILNEGDAGNFETIRMTLETQCVGDSSPTYTQVGNASGASPGSWVQVSGTFSAANCTYLKALLYVGGPDAGIDLYVDDVAVY
jgi:hypothetical protein